MSTASAQTRHQRRRLAVYDFGFVEYQAESRQLSGSFQMADFPTAAHIRERMVVHKKSARSPACSLREDLRSADPV